LAELGGLFALLIGFALAVLFESMFPARSPRRPGQRWTLPKLPRRTRRPQPVDPRRAIAEALARLDWELVARLLAVPGAASDAEIRTRIVQLYSQLLQSVTPGLGNLSSRTAREIEDLGVSRLGLRRETSRELTRLFEEARYSTHPLGRSSLETARAALNRMLDDLRSFSGAW
ncbi:MAG TPA: DUF4129 domain-containing protein, partial [Thermoplasmata archaeon]|nr:DUF4129 domain-containing protein [Thermoplasmata archaeon]